MSAPSQQQQKQQKQQRRNRRPTTSSSKNGEEQLLSPGEARKIIKKLLLSAVDDIADTLKQIPRSQSSSSPAAAGEKLTSTKSINKYRSKNLHASDENRKRSKIFDENQQKKWNQNGRKVSNSRTSLASFSSKSASAAVCEKLTGCGRESIPHGNIDKGSIYCREKYDKCRGKNMYTREAFFETGEPLKSEMKKLNQRRRGQTSTTVTAKTQINQLSASGQETSSKTVLTENIEADTKNVTLKFNIKMVKSDGTPKILDFEIEMPDFEPSFVKVGQKTAFLE